MENITLGVEEELSKEAAGDDKGLQIGMDMDEVKEAAEKSAQMKGQDLEKAIEEVIRSKYSQTIEQFIASAVEKVVTREMESIKQKLMDDDQDLEEGD